MKLTVFALCRKDIIYINDMMLSLRRLQKLPDETKLDRIVEVLKALDEDHDGAIDVNLALKVRSILRMIHAMTVAVLVAGSSPL